MKPKYIFIFFVIFLSILSCTDEFQTEHFPEYPNGTVFRLAKAGYEGESRASATGEIAVYDKLFHYFTDDDGNVMTNVRSYYDSSLKEIHAEGLHEGTYWLLVLGIIGDESEDGAEIMELRHSDDVWLKFPDTVSGPMNAGYFFSRTRFDVATVKTPGDGMQEVAYVPEKIYQKRILSGIAFDFTYASKYVRNSVVTKRAVLDNVRFSTELSGSGEYGGDSESSCTTLEISGDNAFFSFMPVVPETVFRGRIEMATSNYLGDMQLLKYEFAQDETLPNRRHGIATEVIHPDDRLATMYITKEALETSDLGYILQDDEPVEVYTDRSMRMFDTAEPLQVSLTEDGRLHLRFYSPKDLQDVLVKASIPSLGDFYFDAAYFEVIPAFADFYEKLPVLERSLMLRTESGQYMEIPALEPGDLEGIEFKVESDADYWRKLQKIEHGWKIYWGLFGGDPTKEDGGPAGNWMGIRPVHCRESVALFLNFTYMIDMPEHEMILRENADQLYDDNRQPVKVEDVLAKMRQNRTLQVGLVYPGNGVIGLGSPSVFGSYQQGWFEHYFNDYACSVLFHELGHVMGYGHNSSFTYGPWAERLMNKFYVENIADFPVESKEYLGSAGNPYRYK